MPEKRYIPSKPFAVHLEGVHWVFSPDHIEDGEHGYKKLPKGMNKAQRALFRVVGGSTRKVEKATAAPGEER